MPDSTITELLATRLDQFVELIEKAAPKTWEIAMRQVTISAWVNCITAVTILVIVGTLTIWVLRKAVKDDWGNELWCGLSAGGGVISTVMLILTIVNVVELVKVVYNPEYYAIQLITRMVGL